MKVRKAIIPAAGLGTRVLPASKAIPKEMLNIVDKPAIQYIVEEAFASGIEDILIITNRGKGAIEDHFDHAFELEAKLAENPDKNFVGNEPFAVLYGDDVIISDNPVTKQLIDAYEKYGKGAVGVKEVKKEDISKYCSLKTEPIEGNCHLCTDMVEKPKPEEIMGYFSILGRVDMPPEIFSILEHTPKGAGNELQLTDAMKELAKSEGVIAVDYEGKRYDMGNKFGILQANIEVGLRHPEVKEQLKEFLKEITRNEG